MGLVLNKSSQQLEKVIYFSSYIVTTSIYVDQSGQIFKIDYNLDLNFRIYIRYTYRKIYNIDKIYNRYDIDI